MTSDLRTLKPIPATERKKVKKPEKISVTAAGKFDTCPRSFFLYQKYRGGPQSHAMARGTAWHIFRKRFVEMLVENGETSAPPEVAKDLMNAVVAENKDLVIPAHEQHILRGCAWNFATATVIDPDSIVGMEQMLELPIGNYIFRGQLDFAFISPFGYMQIEDDKSGLSVMSADEAANGAKGWQSWGYPLLAAFGVPEGEELPLGTGIDEFHFRFVFPRFTNSETGELVYREVVRTRDQLADYRNTLESHFEKIDHGFETGEWPASPGSHCGQCPARRECPIPEQHHEYEAIESLDEAVAALELHLTRDAVQRRTMRSVRAFAEEHGEPIIVGDYAYAFRQQESRDWARGINGNGLIDPDKVPLKQSTVFAKRKVTEEEREA